MMPNQYVLNVISLVLLIQLAGFAGTGCSRNEVRKNSAEYLRSLSPLSNIDVDAKYNFSLASDARLFVGDQYNPIIVPPGEDGNRLVSRMLWQALQGAYGHVVMSEVKQNLPQALKSAREAGAQFLVWPKLQAIADIKPLKLKNCGSEANPCNPDEVPLVKQRSTTEFQVSIYDVVSGAQVNQYAVNGQRGASAYVKTGLKGQLNDMVTAVVNTMAQ